MISRLVRTHQVLRVRIGFPFRGLRGGCSGCGLEIAAVESRAGVARVYRCGVVRSEKEENYHGHFCCNMLRAPWGMEEKITMGMSLLRFGYVMCVDDAYCRIRHSVNRIQ